MTLRAKYEVKELPDDICEVHDQRCTTTLREKGADGFERCILISGAHRCSKTGGKGHGIGAMRMYFVLVGPLGAVQWIISTGWYTRSTPPFPVLTPGECPPEAWDIGYHSPKPLHAEQHTMGPCDWLGGKPCFYEGSSLRAMKCMPDFLTHPATVWDVLKEKYVACFEALDAAVTARGAAPEAKK